MNFLPLPQGQRAAVLDEALRLLKQRDQELETMHRGQQYIRAVQLYYRKFRRFPPNVDALEDTNMQRFLRKRYADPLTGMPGRVPLERGLRKRLDKLSEAKYKMPVVVEAASAMFRAQPKVVLAWREKDFPVSATRFVF